MTCARAHTNNKINRPDFSGRFSVRVHEVVFYSTYVEERVTPMNCDEVPRVATAISALLRASDQPNILLNL